MLYIQHRVELGYKESFVSQTTKELRMPTAKTNRNHNPIPEKTVRLLSTQPSGVANTTGTPTTKRKDTTINANKAN